MAIDPVMGMAGDMFVPCLIDLGIPASVVTGAMEREEHYLGRATEEVETVSKNRDQECHWKQVHGPP